MLVTLAQPSGSPSTTSGARCVRHACVCTFVCVCVYGFSPSQRNGLLGDDLHMAQVDSKLLTSAIPE